MVDFFAFYGGSLICPGRFVYKRRRKVAGGEALLFA